MLHRFFAAVLGFALVSACHAQTPAAPAADAFQEGRDYVRIDPPQPTSTGDAVEVLEVFGYSCIHCANFDPVLAAWAKRQPETVKLIHVPAVFGGVWEAFARAYYTAETMGLLDKTHDAMFKAVHVEKRPFRSIEDIAAFYADYGVSQEDFLATMQSFAVNAKIARAQQQVPRYGVEGTPTMIVNGKYRVMSPREGGFPRLLDVVDFLVKQELAAKAVAQ